MSAATLQSTYEQVRPLSSLPGRTAPSTASVLLCEKAENVYKKAQSLMGLLNQPARAVTAFSSLALSVQYLFSAPGSIGCFAALISLASSIKELRQLTTPEKTTVDRFLVELSGDLQTVEAIAQIQQEHHNRIEESLESIDRNVEALDARLSDLDTLNTAQFQKIGQHKARALNVQERAHSAYQQAETLFAQAQKDAQDTARIFEECANLHKQIQEIAQSDTPDIQEICRISLKTFAAIKTGCARQGECDKNYQAGLKALAEADQLKTEAFEIVSRALLETEYTLQGNVAQARAAKENAAHIKAAKQSGQKALNHAKADNRHMVNIVTAMGKKLVEADKAVQSKYGTSELIGGIVSTAFLASLAGGVFAIGGGIITASAIHYGHVINKTILCIYRCLSNTPLPELTHIPPGMNAYVEFDRRSSGWWGSCVMGRSSETVGNYTINLGTEQSPYFYVMRFDLNDPNKVSRVQLLQLIEEMNQRLRDNVLNLDQYLAIFESLTQTHVIHGTYTSATQPTLQILSNNDDFLAIIRHLKASTAS